MLDSITPLLSDPAAWAALVTLIVMEVVLGIDNLIFISILSNKLPEHQRQKVRRIGIGLALIMRLALLSIIAWLVGLVQPVFTVMGNEFSWKDLILIAGGLFLVWKATKEIHHTVDPTPSHDVMDKKRGSRSVEGSGAGKGKGKASSAIKATGVTRRLMEEVAVARENMHLFNRLISVLPSSDVARRRLLKDFYKSRELLDKISRFPQVPAPEENRRDGKPAWDENWVGCMGV